VPGLKDGGCTLTLPAPPGGVVAVEDDVKLNSTAAKPTPKPSNIAGV
jgi:hypothetical protein